MKKLWKVWRLNKDELLLTLGAMLVSLLFGSGMVALIVLMSDADSYAVMGSFMAFVVWIAIIVFIGAFSLERRFSMAVAMGETRKSFIVCELLIIAGNTLIEILVLATMNMLEKSLGAVIYQMPCEFDIVSTLLDYRLILAAVIMVPIASMFLGMLIIKFQRKAFWGIWVFWMAISVGMSRIAHIIDEDPDSLLARMLGSVIELFHTLGIAGIALGGILLGAILLAISVAVLRKQAVTQF